MADVLSKSLPLTCISCRRAFARKVEFCPFCRKSQSPVLAKPAVHARDRDHGVANDAPPSGAPAPPAAASSAASHARPEDTRAADQPSIAEVSTAPAPTESKTWWLWISVLAAVVILIACVVAGVFTSGMPRDHMAITATAGSWTKVDWSDFTPDGEIVVSADGPFRVRSSNGAPILVNGGDGVDLSSLKREGLEIKSAAGHDVQVTLEAMKPAP
jgi:hypothetical protein